MTQTQGKLLGHCVLCQQPCRRRGALCMTCYRREVTAKAAAGVIDRFWSKVDAGGDCWVWRGTRTNSGYGVIGIDHRQVPAHRMAYELLVGPIPVGLTLDHLCRNRACVSPAHLEPVTVGANVLRGESRSARNARRTTCMRGHTEWADRRDGAGRWCRACGREDGKRRRSIAA